LSEGFWQRSERLTALRREEQQQMKEYVNLTSGHMEYVIRALDGDPGEVGESALPPLSTATDAALVKEAVAFLRRTSLPIDARKQWPPGGLPQFELSGRIPLAHQAQLGRALCVWGDAGWGDLVRRGKYYDRRFSDDLVSACVALVRDWNPNPSIAWVTCIPSRRHPELVPDFARRLAAALNLPFHGMLEKTDDRPEQKSRANSTQQARNVDGSLAIGQGPVPPGPVLLVDDMVDSRWTLTIAAWLLRSRGSGEVFPLALAVTGQGE
jgi:ATP-dependent DNA helicase RecQ